MTYLLDVNVLVSLAWPNHVHHRRARGWFDRRDAPWATTPVTESGFVRVSSNAAAIREAVVPAEALHVLAMMRRVDGHRFLADDVEEVVGPGLADHFGVASHRFVTDAHLLAVARRHGARLATLDSGISALGGHHPEDIYVLPL